jgi:asparagine synthase (glutamine-hydrolysing)
MCGIAGILECSGRPVNQAELEAFTQRLAHRGPDGAGLHVDGALGLGHRRLAIIDLEGGRQPLGNENGSVWTVFNGEIYNHRELRTELQARGHVFRTRSDTEVIVHGFEQWGVELLHHLRGMFALAVWDSRRRQLLLARDRVGIKPLCYAYDGRRLAFASELQAFRALDGFDPTLDLQAIDLYLHLNYIPHPWTAWQEVRKLPPAHYIVFDEKGATDGPQRYWQLRYAPDRSLSEDQWTERLEAALDDAVQSHLVADVPFGAFLSGGVDSSTVAALMATIMDRPLNAYTIGFNDGECDERPWALRAAEAIGAEHHVDVVQPDALELLPTLVRHYGEPFGDSSAICTFLVCRSARREVKMVLSGDGGDEIFGGYDYYQKLLERFPQPRGLARKGRRRLGDLGRRLGVVAPLPSVSGAWHDRSPFFGEALRGQMLQSELRPLAAASAAWSDGLFSGTKDQDLLSRCQQADIESYLPCDNLTKVDIASMAHGLEVRVPLLDHRLLEIAARIPPELRVNPAGTKTKALLTKVGSRFFPDGFFERPKRGFSVPIRRWLGAVAPDKLIERIEQPTGMASLLEPGAVRALVTGGSDDPNQGHRLWALLFLSEWLRQFPTRIR